ncbi:tRNA synthetases class I (M)-domain-containing protein [Amanita rubescens]|nr:tRNA synthetases class I (M)-domain-containing protein [Amanita rubescens]
MLCRLLSSTARRGCQIRPQCSFSSSRSRAEVEKPYYITTPIFYPNAAPHIGHLYSLVVADIYARPVYFLTGTDEHGLKMQRAAEAKGIPPKEFCDRQADVFRSLAKHAQISYTQFTRTTSDTHHRAVEHVWRTLDAKGLIYKGNYSGWYSVTDECFYTDAEVSKDGTSNMISLETGSSVEWQEETNYMLRLSEFQSALLDHYQAAPHSNIIFPPHHQSHVIDILSEPLEDLSVSRPRSRLSWGVPVPTDPDQTVYVWIDALLAYLSGRQYPWNTSTGHESPATYGWPVDLQVIGKDILRFHAIYFPALLLALDLPLPRRLLSHAHWTVGQKKMSKSRGNIVDPFEAIDAFGIDVVRYYLARVGGRFRDDVDWSDEQLKKHFKEIRAFLGNTLLRITSERIKDNMKGASVLTLEDILRDTTSPNASIIEASQALAENMASLLEQMEVADAIARVVNKVMTDIAPWEPTTKPDVVYTTYLTSVEALRVVGICLQPFTPGVASRLLDALRIPREERNWENARVLRDHVGAVEGVKLF